MTEGRRGVFVLRDVQRVDPHLAVVDPGIGLGQLGLAGPQRLDLAALEHHAGLDGVEDLELAARLTVRRHDLRVGRGHRAEATGDVAAAPSGGRRTGPEAVACPAMLQLTDDVRTAMVAHALRGLPHEACGLFSGPAGDGRLATVFHPDDQRRGVVGALPARRRRDDGRRAARRRRRRARCSE